MNPLLTIRRSIIDSNRCTAYPNSSLRASRDVDIIVPGSIMCNILQALWQRTDKLFIERSCHTGRFVRSIQSNDVVKVAGFAFREEVFS